MIQRTMKIFEDDVDRSNAKTKCLGLFEESSRISSELYYMSYLSNDIGRRCRCNLIVGIIPKYENLWIFILQILIVCVNVLTVLSFNL